MSQHLILWRRFAAAGFVLLIAACAQDSPPQAVSQTVASNPPPVAPGPTAVWYNVLFESNSVAVNANAQKVVDDVVAFMQRNPATVATLIGRADTLGSNDYNMRLSHRRADAVRDALVYGGKVAPDRVETRWTGESRQSIATAKDIAATSDRVVDIAIH